MNRGATIPILALASWLAGALLAPAPAEAREDEVDAGEPGEETSEEGSDSAEGQPEEGEDEGEEGEEEEPSAPVVRWVEEPTEPVIEEDLTAEEEGVEEGTGAPPGPRYALQRIEVVGNHKTMRQVILRYVELRPGEVFSADDPRLERARYRLLATGFFHGVDLSLKRGDRRGWAVLVITVSERNTIVARDLVIGFSEITGYGSFGVEDRSFFGSGIRVSASAVISEEQWGYRIRFGDDHFLDSDFGLYVEGLYSHARDFFGRSDVRVGTSEEVEPYAVLPYDRAGAKVGTGYSLVGDLHLSIGYRFENVRAEVPAAASHYSFGERRPIDFGHVLPGPSYLSSFVFGLARDTRDHPLLPSEGSRTDFAVELSTEMLGSDYEFSKFTLAHDTWFPLGKGHAIRLSLFGGLIMGDAPFYNQFFVGDFSAFVPSRVLELNFSHLAPSLLETSVQEMRYEDLALSIGVEYSIPFYRGDGFFYGVDGFIGIGLFALASRDDLRTDPKGYQGYEVVPMDLTADIGVKVDTMVGVLVLSLANLFRLIPYVGEETAE